MASKRDIALISLVAVLLLGATGYVFQDRIMQFVFQPQQPPGDVESGISTPGSQEMMGEVEVVAEDLDIPWEVRFLPSGDMLVTERPGTLVRIGEDNTRYDIEGVRHSGEGGLLGMALHPDFEDNRWIYLYSTSEAEAGGLINRVERYRLEDDRLTDRTEIITGIPGASYHDGGRIEFGPDGLLYVTTGDSGDSQLAQDRDTLAGKILRLEPDSSIPEDNPFGTPVYSYGHRNPQGLTWDDQNRLWSTEHGRSGVRSGFDELNLIEEGKNYGWPVIQGLENRSGMWPPELQSGPDYTWAPASAAYWNGSIFFGGLRGSAVYEAKINGEEPDLTAHFLDEFGRIRAVRQGPDGKLYFTTSNTDGRGNPQPGDDKVLRVDPATFR